MWKTTRNASLMEREKEEEEEDDGGVFWSKSGRITCEGTYERALALQTNIKHVQRTASILSLSQSNNLLSILEEVSVLKEWDK